MLQLVLGCMLQLILPTDATFVLGSNDIDASIQYECNISCHNYMDLYRLKIILSSNILYCLN